MYVRRFWEILIVDDEPDVHAVTKLVLQSIDIWGIPLQVRSANSAAEAMKLLPTWRVGTEGASELALAFIDVVMESDSAGLDLCRHIRRDLKNSVTQLVVRTGQAGKAPEREVIDRFDISGYIAKVEATQDRLYTIVKSGVRQYMLLRVSQGSRAINNAVTAAFATGGRKESAIYEVLPRLMNVPNVNVDGAPLPGVEGHMAMLIDDQVFGIGEMKDRAAALKKRDELRERPVTITGPNGETCREAPGEALISLPSGERNLELVGRTSFDGLPDFVAASFYGWMTTIRHLLSISVK
jgi:CheY-like chemotaxis protein